MIFCIRNFSVLLTYKQFFMRLVKITENKKSSKHDIISSKYLVLIDTILFRNAANIEGTSFFFFNLF